MQNPEKKAASTGEKINEFVQGHRKPIYIAGITIIALLAVCIAAFALGDFLHGKAIAELEDLNGRYETLSDSINEEYSSDDVAQLLADLDVFAKKTSGYPGGKAWALVGAIYSEKTEWAEAETAWAAAAKAAKKTYLGPVAFFNAGAAAEEQGKTAQAIEYYTASLATDAVFPAASRAQFSVGRLQEALNEDDAAIEAYRAVISGWPYDRTWTNLAFSRIIALEAK